MSKQIDTKYSMKKKSRVFAKFSTHYFISTFLFFLFLSGARARLYTTRPSFFFYSFRSLRFLDDLESDSVVRARCTRAFSNLIDPLTASTGGDSFRSFTLNAFAVFNYLQRADVIFSYECPSQHVRLAISYCFRAQHEQSSHIN